MRKSWLITLLLTCLPVMAAEAPHLYKGLIRLPYRVQTYAGQSLENGEYEIEIKVGEKPELVFLQNNQAKLSWQSM